MTGFVVSHEDFLTDIAKWLKGLLKECAPYPVFLVAGADKNILQVDDGEAVANDACQPDEFGAIICSNDA